MPETTEELRARRGAALRQRREAAGLSIRKLALSAGISNVSVGAIEKGEQGVSDQTWLALAGALGCEVDDLFTAPTTEGVA